MRKITLIRSAAMNHHIATPVHYIVFDNKLGAGLQIIGMIPSLNVGGSEDVPR